MGMVRNCSHPQDERDAPARTDLPADGPRTERVPESCRRDSRVQALIDAFFDGEAASFLFEDDAA